MKVFPAIDLKIVASLVSHNEAGGVLVCWQFGNLLASFHSRELLGCDLILKETGSDEWHVCISIFKKGYENRQTDFLLFNCYAVTCKPNAQKPVFFIVQKILITKV